MVFIDSHTERKKLNTEVKPIKKDLGIFFTPQWIVDFMVNLIDDNRLNSTELNILEPACGLCQFLYGIKESKKELYYVSKKIGVEINKNFVDYIYKNNLNNDIEIIYYDYLLWKTDKKFDIIIGNPPYGIPSLSSHYTIKVDNETKKTYKQLYETWYGKYNVYGAFIEKSIKLLKENGQLIVIVPATFMILDEFKKLRDFLAKNGKTEIIYIGSKVFKPEADVIVAILKFTKSKYQNNHLLLYDYDKQLKLITKNDKWNGGIVLFSTQFTKAIEEVCSFRFEDIYTIKISPRTTEIKQNSNVINSKNLIDTKNMLPILNSKNLKMGKIIYKPITNYWIDANKKTELRNFFDKPHIVVGLGFRKDRQVGAAYDYKAYPWMGDVYHLLRKPALINTEFDLTDEEVVNFLNSETIKQYIQDTFRDITYHFSITQLKLIPLPTKEELQKMKNLL